MTRTVTYVPDIGAPRVGSDLRYVERLSRNRSLHILIEDASATRGACRRQFALATYRTAIEHYLARGRIEHPLPILRDLARRIAQLARQDDSRMGDFQDFGLYMVVQDANVLFLLMGTGGFFRVHRAGDWLDVTRTCEGVHELPLDGGPSQAELFSQDADDFLRLYRIEFGEERAGCEVIFGGSDESLNVVGELLMAPGFIAPADSALESARVAQSVLHCTFDRAQPARVEIPTWHAQRSTVARTTARRAGTLAFALALIGTSGWLVHSFDSTRRARSTKMAVSSDFPDAAKDRSGAGAPGIASRPLAAAQIDTRQTTEPGDSTERAPRFELAWSRSFSLPVTTNPVVSAGLVIFGSRDGSVYAYDATTGDRRWRYKAAAGVGASPVLTPRGVVVADYSGQVALLDVRTGKQRWTRALGARIVGTPGQGDGTVSVGCINGKSYGLSIDTGHSRWTVDTGGRIRGGSAFLRGRFYIPSASGYVYAVSCVTGRVEWKHPIGTPVMSTPDAADDRVVFGSDDGRVYALELQRGERLWSFASGAPVRSFVTIGHGNVLAGSTDHSLYCLNEQTGEEIWRFRTDASVFSRPARIGDLVFVTSYDRNLYCVDGRTGAELARFATTGAVYSSPAVAGRRVYVGNNDGRFYAIGFAAAPTM